MSTTFVLSIPEEAQTPELVNAYYDLVAEKETEFGTGQSQLPRAREHALETLETQGRIAIYEYPSILNKTQGDGWRDVYDVLDLMPDGGYIADTEEQVEELLRVFRQITRNLLAKAPIVFEREGLTYTAEDIEYGVETGVVALCEFAIERGYSVVLDH